MEVIFPWERDDIVVRSRAGGSSEEAEGAKNATDRTPFATMLATLATYEDNEARIQALADGIQTVVHSSEMTTEEVLSRVESALKAGDATERA